MKCVNCGAEMVFDPASGKLTCEYCGTQVDPEAKVEKPVGKEASEHAADGDTYEATVYLCRSCGAELLVTDDTAVTFCSYCGSQTVIRGRMETMKKPAFVIPFTKTKEECEEAYRKMLRRSAFVPSNMKDETTVEKFRGIYMPYWVYDIEGPSTVHATGHKSTRRGDYVITRHFNLTAPGHARYDGISFDASSSFSDNLSQCIAPYDMKGSREFDSRYLSGFYTDVADVESNVYRSDAEGIVTAHIANEVQKDRTFIQYGVFSDELQKTIGTRIRKERMGLFPVWFLGCRSKDGQRISYAVVNGQTGKVAADLPMDFGKYIAGSALMAIPIFLLLNLFLTLTPFKALGAAVVLALISLLVSNSQLNEIYTRENQLDDKGINFAEAKAGNRKAINRNLKSDGKAGLPKITFDQIGKALGIIAVILMANLGSLLESEAGFVIFCVIVALLIVGAAVSALVSAVNAKSKATESKVFRMPFAEKQKQLIFQELAIVVALFILVLDPAGDIWYYGAASVSMACIVASFYGLVKGHNQLTTRKLPQMAARGGDEYELS